MKQFPENLVYWIAAGIGAVVPNRLLKALFGSRDPEVLRGDEPFSLAEVAGLSNEELDRVDRIADNLVRVGEAGQETAWRTAYRTVLAARRR